MKMLFKIFILILSTFPIQNKAFSFKKKAELVDYVQKTFEVMGLIN